MLSTTLSFANIDYKYTSFNDLGKETFSVSALMTEINSFKVQNSSGIGDNLSDINNQQLNYNLSAIDGMQEQSGSGLFFRQSKMSFNSIMMDGNVSNNYNNTLSTKLTIDNHQSIMASVNEGQSSFNHGNGSFQNGSNITADTKNIGVSVAYNKRFDEKQNIYAFVGKNWIDNGASIKNLNAEQVTFGVGVKYHSDDEKVIWSPNITFQKMKSDAHHNFDSVLNQNWNNQTTASIGLSTNYKLSNSFAFGAGVIFEKRLSENNNSIKNGQYVDFKSLDNPTEKYGVSLSMNYHPVENMNFMVDYKQKFHSAGVDSTLNVGVRYHF